MTSNGSCVIALKVTPGARKNSLQRLEDGWKAQVAAPPVDGQANARLTDFLAEEVLGLPRRAVRVKSGASGRKKLIEIDASAETVEAAFAGWLEAHP